MSLGFVVLADTTSNGEGPWLTGNGAGPLTGGAIGVFKRLSLTVKQVFDGAGGESLGGGRGNVFDGVEVEVERRPIGVGTLGDNFAPLFGEATEIVKVLLAKRSRWHVRP
jgi:hypothetical protein